MKDQLENYAAAEIITAIRICDKTKEFEKALLNILQTQRIVGMSGLMSIMAMLDQRKEEDDNDE